MQVRIYFRYNNRAYYLDMHTKLVNKEKVASKKESVPVETEKGEPQPSQFMKINDYGEGTTMMRSK